MRNTLAIIVLAFAGILLIGFSGLRFASMGDPAPLPPPESASTAAPSPTQTPGDPLAYAPAGPSRTYDPAPAPTPAPTPSVPVATQPPVEPATPTGLTVSSQDITGPVIPVNIDYDLNQLEVPEDVHDIGWYEGGAPVGAEHGTTLLTAHVNTKTQGWGAFANLYAVAPGDEIEVAGDDGVVHTYVADQVVAQPKDALDQTVFNADGDPRLVMVTCGGDMRTLPDGTRSHTDNVVVYASPE